MSRRRITIYDYPEHLNPFYEEHKIERKPDIKKYGTWGATSRSKIRKSITDSTWLDALNLSPAKKQVSKKWSFIKTHTVEKLLRGRLNLSSPNYTVQKPQREVIHIRPQRLFSERLASTSTPYNDKLNDCSPEKVDQLETEVIEESNQPIVPKMRKKRAAPRPPSSMVNTEPERSIDMDTWNAIERSEQLLPQLEEKETHEPEPIYQNQTIQETIVDANQISLTVQESNVIVHSHDITV